MTRERTIGRIRWAFLGSLAIAALTALPATVSAAIFQPDGATASSHFGSAAGYGPGNTINGSGLSSLDPSTPHAAYASGNHWTSSGSAPLSQWIRWSFAAPQALGSIYIWNHQSSAGHASNPGYDVTLFDLTLFDNANNALLTWNDVALAPDVATAQAFSFGSVIGNVSSVLFDIEAVQSSPNYTGLAEVAFSNVAAIPEPSTYALMLAGLGVIGYAAHRRRRPGTAA